MFNSTKFREDSGSGVLVAGVLGIMLLILIGGLALDTAKNSYFQSAIRGHAQQSVEASLQMIDSRGNLSERAVNRVVSEYNHGTEVNAYDTGVCSKRDITLWDGTIVKDAPMPYIEMRFDSERKRSNTMVSPVYTSAGGKSPQLVHGQYIPGQKYTVMYATVHDSKPNFILSMAGMPCQDFSQNVSAITFGSNQDIPSVTRR